VLIAEPLVVSPRGEFDIYTKDRLVEILANVDAHPFVVVDFSGVRYIDSSCIAVLIRMRKRRLIAGLPAAHFAALNPMLHRVFAIAALDQVFPMFDTVEEARAAFAQP
jgi:anti-anti-sigma factor